MSGFLGDLSEAQERALSEVQDKFKLNLTPDGLAAKFRLDARTLLKFLRARNFDVGKTCAMISEHLKWRAEWSPQTVTIESPGVQDIMASGVWRFHAPTEEFPWGMSVIRIEHYHPDKIKHEDDFVRAVIYLNQTSFNANFRNAFRREQGIILFDVKAWSLYDAAPSSMKFVRLLTELSQNHFPETLHRAFILNAPSLFALAWAVIQKWLDPIVAQKIVFLDGSDADFAKLNEFLPKEQLPKMYGGSMEAGWPIPGVDSS